MYRANSQVRTRLRSVKELTEFLLFFETGNGDMQDCLQDASSKCKVTSKVTAPVQGHIPPSAAQGHVSPR